MKTIKTICPVCGYTRKIVKNADNSATILIGTKDFDELTNQFSGILICPKCGTCCSKKICQTQTEE